MSTTETPRPTPKPKPDRKPRRPPDGVYVYTIEETAFLLRVSPTSVRRLFHSRQLSGRRVAGRLRFAPRDLERYVESAAETAGAPEPPERAAAQRARGRGIVIDPRVIEGTAGRKGKGQGKGARK